MKETIEHLIARPAERRRKTPIFLQHGLCHGANCWKQFMEYLPTLGYEVHAVSVPGHGNSSLARENINRYSLQDYIDYMSEEIAGLNEPPVLIGHSMGGLMAMKYLESHGLPGAVLMASAPHNGVYPLLWRLFREKPLLALRVPLTWNLRIPNPEIAKLLFLGEDTDIDMQEFMANLKPDSMKVGVDMVLRVRPDTSKINTPTMVIAGEKDFCFSVKEEIRLADALGAKFVVMPGQAHDLMLEPAWKDVADLIDNWLVKELGLP